MPQLASGQLIAANFCFQRVRLERATFQAAGHRSCTLDLTRAVVSA